MDVTKKNLKEEIVTRIENHGFHPTMTYKTSPHAHNVVVYKADLPKKERSKYVKNYYDSDKHWVKKRGRNKVYNLVAELRCKWI